MAHKMVINGVEIPGAEINRLDLSLSLQNQILIALTPSQPSKGQAAIAAAAPSATVVDLYNDGVKVATFGPFAKAEVRIESSQQFGFEEHIIFTNA